MKPIAPTPEIITSPHNQLIKQIISLKQKKQRDELGLFVVEGVRLCEDFVASDWRGEVCLYTPSSADVPRVDKVLKSLAAEGCRMVQVPEGVFSKAADTEMPQGILIVAAKRHFAFSDLLPPDSPPLIAVLDGIQDPGNAGVLIRTADAAGCSGVILTRGCADLFAAKTVRATMGSLFHLPVLAGLSHDELLAALATAALPVAAAALESAVPYYLSDLTGPLAIAFGNEGQGLSPALLAAAGCRLVVPQYGLAESLNVAAAAAVILFEAARQRRVNL
ncbi:MAG: RNA methyltransferase [Negativicutes bacterium]|nr:RNA methyltransferase [Negativicutes bacterium]